MKKLLFVFVIFVFAACSQSKKELILGEWISEDNEGEIYWEQKEVFNEDKSWTFSVNFFYKFKNDTEMPMQRVSINGNWDINGDTLTIIHDKSNTGGIIGNNINTKGIEKRYIITINKDDLEYSLNSEDSTIVFKLKHISK